MLAVPRFGERASAPKQKWNHTEACLMHAWFLMLILLSLSSMLKSHSQGIGEPLAPSHFAELAAPQPPELAPELRRPELSPLAVHGGTARGPQYLQAAERYELSKRDARRVA